LLQRKISGLQTNINSSNIKAVSYKTVVWFSAVAGAWMPEKRSGFQTRSVALITGNLSPQKLFLFLVHRDTLWKSRWKKAFSKDVGC